RSRVRMDRGLGVALRRLDARAEEQRPHHPRALVARRVLVALELRPRLVDAPLPEELLAHAKRLVAAGARRLLPRQLALGLLQLLLGLGAHAQSLWIGGGFGGVEVRAQPLDRLLEVVEAPRALV